MKKFLSLFAALSLSAMSATSTVSCSSADKDYFEWITGFDVVNYTTDLVRDKKSTTTISSTSTDVITSIKDATSSELAIVKLSSKMNIFWSYKDKNSLLFGTNNPTDYSTWDYVVPQDSPFTTLHPDFVGFTTDKYQYIVLEISAETDVGEIIQIMNDDNDCFSFAINVDDLKNSGSFTVDLSKLSNSEGSDPVVVNLKSANGDTEATQTLIIQSLIARIIQNGLLSSDPNVRYLSACARSLCSYDELASDLASLFTFDNLPTSIGTYDISAALNTDLVDNLVDNYKAENQCKIQLKIINQ